MNERQKMYRGIITKKTLRTSLDLDLLKKYMDQIHDLFQVPITILGLDGEVLVASEWTGLCSRFMRGDARIAPRCVQECNDLGKEKERIFTCPNGLKMCRMPILVKKEVVAYMVISQFFLQPPDETYFQQLIEQYEFSARDFQEELSKVPVLEEKKLDQLIAMVENFVILLHDMLHKSLKVQELEEQLMDSFSELEASYQDVSNLNSELTIKSEQADSNEKQAQLLLENMRQGILYLVIDPKAHSYEIMKTNKMADRILQRLRDVPFLNHMTEENLFLDFIYHLIEVDPDNFKKVYKSSDQHHYEVEGGFISATEVLVCITDATKYQEKIESQRQQTWDIVAAMGKLVEKRDLYTAEHQKKVAILATRIAIEMELPTEQIESVFLASLLHDIGKVGIPSEILTKPDKLSEIEYQLIKTHVEHAYEILRPIHFTYPIADIVRQHHEKLNGSGYPRGLKEEEILLEAKIIVVADVVEAITSHRPYRPSLGIEFALAHIEEEKAILYDTGVVEACMAVIAEKKDAFSAMENSKKNVDEDIKGIEDYIMNRK